MEVDVTQCISDVSDSENFHFLVHLLQKVIYYKPIPIQQLVELYLYQDLDVLLPELTVSLAIAYNAKIMDRYTNYVPYDFRRNSVRYFVMDGQERGWFGQVQKVTMPLFSWLLF